MASLLLSTLQHLEQAGIQYCILRDAEQINTRKANAEIDLVVAKRQMKQLWTNLTRLGFIALPSWGHTPHRFFVGYDMMNDCWLKLDVVTDIAYGYPYHTMYTDLAVHCLARRRKEQGVYTPATEDELIMLIFHCILDKRRFDEHRRQRIKTLCNRISDEQAVVSLLQHYGQPTLSWPQLAAWINNDQWHELLALRPTLSKQLIQQQRFMVGVRQMQQRLLRKLNQWLNQRRPRSITVAILAPDGAGKSTVVAGIQQTFYFPVYTTYMGLYQKGGSRRSTAGILGTGFLYRLIQQWRRYATARYQQARRKLVIFDRYTYDSLLPSGKPLTRLQQWRRWLLAHACPAPNLVILLDAPGEVLYARKKEHSVELLESRRQSYLNLQTEVPQTVVIDATQDMQTVRRMITKAIWGGYVLRQAGQPVSGIRDQIQEYCGIPNNVLS